MGFSGFKSFIRDDSDSWALRLLWMAACVSAVDIGYTVALTLRWVQWICWPPALADLVDGNTQRWDRTDEGRRCL